MAECAGDTVPSAERELGAVVPTARIGGSGQRTSGVARFFRRRAPQGAYDGARREAGGRESIGDEGNS